MPLFDPFAVAPAGGYGADVTASVHQAAAGMASLGAAVGLPTQGIAADQQRQAANAVARAGAGGIPQSFDDVQTPMDVLRFAGGQLAQAAPTLAEVAAGAVTGGLSDVLVGAGSAAARAVGKSAIESAVAQGVERSVAEKAVGKVLAKQAGGAAATYPGAVGQNLETQYNQSGNYNLGEAAAAGIPEAALNVVGPEGRLAGGVLKPLAESGSRVGNAIGNAIIGSGSQAMIGAAQGELNEVQKSVVDPSYDLLGNESLKNVAAASAGGAVIGGAIGGVHGLIHTPEARGDGEAGGITSRDMGTAPKQLPQDQPSLDLMGGSGERPGTDGTTPGLRPKLVDNAQAGSAGPTVADAVDGLQSMHADLTTQLQQLMQADQSDNPAAQPGTRSGQIADVSASIAKVEQHLAALDAQPRGQQAPLDFSQPQPGKTRLPDAGAQLFADPAGVQQTATAKALATTPAPEPVPAAQPIVRPGEPVPNPAAKIVAPATPAATPQLPTAFEAAQRRFQTPEQPTAPRIEVPGGEPAAREPVAPVVTPEAKPGFQLRGTETPQFENRPVTPGAPFELEPQEGRQGELPLHGGSDSEGGGGDTAPTHDTQTADMFGGGQAASTPWQTRMRIAWKDQSDGSLQGFHKAMKDALAAKSPEDAAAALREKANDPKSHTSYEKLDAVHRALTGETLEQGGIREAREAAPEPEGVKPAAEGDTTAPVEREGVDTQAETPPARVPVDETAVGETPQREADVAQPAVEEPSDYQKRAASVEEHTAALETTRDPAEFQQHVNALYRLWQDRGEGDVASHRADIFLHDPENGVTDENLKAAANQYDQDEIGKLVEHSVREALKTRRADSASNPDTGRRTMLSDALRDPAAQHTAQSMATHLAQHAKNPAVRNVMQMVLKHRQLDASRIHIVGEGDKVPAYIEHEFNTGADAVTTREARPSIYVQDHAADEETMAHEILHAALPQELKAGTDGGATSLMHDVRESMQRAGLLDTEGGRFFAETALKEPNEFLSYGLSSPALQKLFARLDNPTLWDRFKAAVGKVLSIPKAFLDRLLDRDTSTYGDGSPTLSRLSRVLESALQEDTPESEAARIETYRQSSTTAEGASDTLKTALGDVWSHAAALGNRIVFANMPTHAIADSFEHVLPAVRDVQRSIEERTISQHKFARRAAVVHDLMNKAYTSAGKTLERVNHVMEDSQIARADPRDPRALDNVQSAMKAAKDALDRVTRAKDSTPLDVARAREALRRESARARLADTWRQMSPPERAAVSDAFDALKESMAARQKAANDILLSSAAGFHDETLDQMRADGAPQQAINDQILKTYGREFRTAQEPYAPFKRYGDWVTTASSKDYRAAESELRNSRIALAGDPKSAEAAQRVADAREHLGLLARDPEHRIVQFHDTSVEAQKRADELRATHPDMEVGRFARENYMQHAGSLSGGAIGKIVDAVGKELPPELRDNIGAVIKEMYVDSLPDNSFDQSQQGRGGVAGYSTDFSRGVLDTLLRDSFNISTLENSDRMGAAMKGLDTQRRAAQTDTANNIYKTLAKRIAFTTDHRNFKQWEQRISEVTHAFYLGLSPGFMLMNMMQMPMITMPMLYARYGLHANGTMTKAIADVWDSVKKGNLDHLGSTRLTDAEKEVLTRGQNLGILNMTQLHDMAMTARSSNIIDPQTAGEHAAKGWEVSKDFANLPAQYVETVNRAASALAAYRLGVEGKSRFGKMEHGAAMDYAMKIVRDSHVDYSASNNASWLRAPGARVLFQFKKYWLNMLSMTALNMWDAYGHPTDVKNLRNALADKSLPEEQRAAKQQMLDSLLARRGVARRTLAGLYGTHFVHTGALGMPFAGAGIALSNVMRNWYNDPEDHADSATDLQNWLAGVFGVEPADTMMHGVWAGMFGAGISERIGMGNLANPVRLGNQRVGTNAKDFVDEMLEGAAGPSVGMGLQLMQGVEQMNKGNYMRGLEKMLPLKPARDILTATRYAGEGQASTPAGKTITPLDNWDAIKQAVGITPEKVINAYQAQTATANEKTTFQAARKELVQTLAQAQKENDSGAAMDVQQKVDAFNERNPGQRITVSDVLKARNAIGKPPKPENAKQKALDARVDRGAFAKDE